MMRLSLTSPKLVFLYGVLIWVIAFTVSFVIFPLRTDNRPLFESIMPVTLVVLTVGFSILYFPKVQGEILLEALSLGILWLLINIAIDLLLFLPPSPMQMTFLDYMGDIGVTYVLIVVIPLGFGYLLSRNQTA